MGFDVIQCFEWTPSHGDVPGPDMGVARKTQRLGMRNDRVVATNSILVTPHLTLRLCAFGHVSTFQRSYRQT